MPGQKLKSNDYAAMQLFDVQPGAKPYELTAQVVAVIAYPAPEDAEKRNTAAAHLRAGYVRWLHDRDSEIARKHAQLDDALIDPHEAAKTRRKLETILRKRLLAGHMAAFFLKGAQATPPVSSLPGVGKLTIENVSAVISDAEASDDRNLRRVFAEASPVLHLVAAWAILTRESFRISGSAPDIYELMESPRAAQMLLEEARRMEVLVDRSPALSKAQASLIRFSPRQG